MDTVAPTPERLAKAREWDRPELERRARRDHFRRIGVVESMHRRGWLRDEQRLAFERFEADYCRARAETGITSRYGTLAGGDPIDALDHRLASGRRLREATRFLSDPETVAALQTLCGTHDVSLEEIGRTCGGERNRTSAIAAGKKILQLGLYRLAVHYGLLQPVHGE